MVSARPRAVRLLALVVAMLLAIPVAAAGQSLSEVEKRRKGLEQELEALSAQLEKFQSEIAVVTDELESLGQRAQELAEQVVTVELALAERARSAYKHGIEATSLATLISSSGPQEAIDRASLLDTLARRDDATLESAGALRQLLSQTEILLNDRKATLDDLQERQKTVISQVSSRLSDARVLEADLRERAARQRQIRKGLQSGTYACPVARPFAFVDSWGAPRSGGRRHKGVDIMNPYGNKLFAFTHGRISSMRSSSLGGISIYVWGDDGHRYYYAHLSGYAPGMHVGKRVEAGQLIAYNGDSGNARGGAPHLHFEVHPYGGAAVNPYPWVSAACH